MHRKMRVFGKIAHESRQAIIATRQGLPPPPTSAGKARTSTDPASNEEASLELDRERSFGSTVDQIDADSRMTSSSISDASPATGLDGGIRGATKGAWDKIRLGGGVTGGDDGGSVRGSGGTIKMEDKRTKEQRDFDEMLERERRGMDSGTDEGKWR
jgi:hypothetical protein